METERTIRRNGKWAKLTGSRGKWTVAMGWQGEFKANRVLTTPTKDMGLTFTRGWVDD